MHKTFFFTLIICKLDSNAGVEEFSEISEIWENSEEIKIELLLFNSLLELIIKEDELEVIILKNYIFLKI